MVMAGKAARITGPRIRKGRGSIGSDDVHIKVDQALAGNGPADAAHTMSSVAGRAREAIVDVPGVFAETGIRHDLAWVVALGAKGERSIHAEVWAGKKIGNKLAGSRSLAELVAAFQDVSPL